MVSPSFDSGSASSCPSTNWFWRSFSSRLRSSSGGSSAGPKLDRPLLAWRYVSMTGLKSSFRVSLWALNCRTPTAFSLGGMEESGFRLFLSELCGAMLRSESPLGSAESSFVLLYRTWFGGFGSNSGGMVFPSSRDRSTCISTVEGSLGYNGGLDGNVSSCRGKESSDASGSSSARPVRFSAGGLNMASSPVPADVNKSRCSPYDKSPFTSLLLHSGVWPRFLAGDALRDL